MGILLVVVVAVAVWIGVTLSGGDDEGGDLADAEAAAIEHAVGDFAEQNWATFGYGYSQNRHVPFDEITKENVDQMGKVWEVDFVQEDDSIPEGNESYPLYVNGTLYVTTSFNHIFAVDAESGDVKWHFIPSEIGPFKNFGLNVNRGVAFCDGKVFMVTLDMRLISVDAETGELADEVYIYDTVKDAKPEFGYYETMAPVCYQDVVLIGSSGADNGVRGFFMGYNTDLTPAWENPYWTIPPEGQGWRSHGRFHGGGATWMPPAVDPETDTAYFTSSNPSPDFFPELRPGPNPKTNAVIAVDALTGEERWWRQQLPADEWDYDTVQPPQVIEAEVGGEARKIVSIATKQGVWFAYDAETGEPIYERVEVLNRVEHPKLQPGEPVTIWPGAVGGVTYSPASYDPTTNYVINGRIESSATLVQVETAEEVERNRVRGDVDTGLENGFGEAPEDYDGDRGGLTAIDLANGEVAWKFDVDQAVRGGVTTTATGLAFFGGDDGFVRAIDTSTGEELWQFQTGSRIATAPILYEQDGQQYLAIVTGGSPIAQPKSSKLEVFALGGDMEEGEAPERIVPTAEQAPEPEGLGQYFTPGAEPKTVDMLVVGSQGSTNGGMNFNGYSREQLTFSVPQGWSVDVTFKNVSAQIPHSAMVTAKASTEMSQGQQPVFKGAATPDPGQGILSGTQYMNFKATKQGEYALLCAVPGHATAGMWVNFSVTAPDTKPAVSTDQERFVVEPAE
ncbi:MAG: PQQ-binding-like beta-propeller repeat protein [Propionibacteriales bacterium]|nr:PQQ-binding-like beta-propeller repeat protein [Propionibacteriales bacterium]